MKVCGGAGDSITALNFGPFDNGYILAGMQSGKLLIFDPVTLKRMQEFKVFTEDRSEDQKAQAISKIMIEPTELVLVSSKQGNLVAISIIKKQMHYVYIDLGNKQYCTVAIPKENGECEDDDRKYDPLQPLYDQNPETGLCCM